MKQKFSPKYLTVALFVLLFVFLFVGQLLKSDRDISFSERRPLEQKPELSFDALRDGSYFDDYETYLLDQAILRETFRQVKATSAYYLLGKKDNNGLYRYGDSLHEILRYNQTSFEKAGEKIEALSQKLAALNCYYAMIPDKNALIQGDSKRPAIDLATADKTLSETITSATRIDLTALLSVDSYYKTDLHWRQEKLLPIAEKLLLGMNNNAVQYSFSETVLHGFRGVYYGQSALPFASEEMRYLTASAFDDITVEDMTQGKSIPLYNEAAFDEIDPYSVFVGGPLSLIRITNSDVQNGKILYLFRDSFASSLSPLLLCGYSEIVLIDLRYIDSRALDYFIEFKAGQDVLFLYSTHILNESAMLR